MIFPDRACVLHLSEETECSALSTAVNKILNSSHPLKEVATVLNFVLQPGGRVAPAVTQAMEVRRHLGHESQPLTPKARGKEDQITGASVTGASALSLSLKPCAPFLGEF